MPTVVTGEAAQKFAPPWAMADEKVTAPSADQISRAVAESKEIGRGGNAVVLDIPGTPFVIKKPNGARPLSGDETLVKENDAFEGINYGQPVFSFGDLQILRRQNGAPAGLTNYRGLSQEQADAQYAES